MYLFQPEEFTSLTDDQRTTMKWKFLLERCKVYVKVLEHCVSRALALQANHVLKYCYTALQILPSMKTKPGIKGIVVSCSLAEPAEVKQHVCSLQQL